MRMFQYMPCITIAYDSADKEIRYDTIEEINVDSKAEYTA